MRTESQRVAVEAVNLAARKMIEKIDSLNNGRTNRVRAFFHLDIETDVYHANNAPGYQKCVEIRPLMTNAFMRVPST